MFFSYLRFDLLMNSLVQQIKLDFAIVDFHDTYVVCKICSGISIDTEKVVMLHKLYRKYYGEKRYGYIFDRTSDFTIDPISYMQCPYYPDVTAFAIVAPHPTTKKTVLFEQEFAKKRLKIFDTLGEAQAWMEAYNKELGLY